MNIRRFLPHWGSALAWPAMAALAEARPDVHLVLLGGAASDADMTGRGGSRGPRPRPRRPRDLRPWRCSARHGGGPHGAGRRVAVARPHARTGIVERAAGRGLRERRRDGRPAVLRPRGRARTRRPSPVVVWSRRHRRGGRGAARRSGPCRPPWPQANARYLSAHHDREIELTRLLRIVAGAATADRLLAAGPRPRLSRRRLGGRRRTGSPASRPASEIVAQHLGERLRFRPGDMRGQHHAVVAAIGPRIGAVTRPQAGSRHATAPSRRPARPAATAPRLPAAAVHPRARRAPPPDA